MISPASGAKGGWLSRLKDGLTKTRVNIVGLFSGGVVDESFLEELEMALIGADVGVTTSARLIGSLRQRIKLSGLKTQDEVRLALRDELAALLAPAEGRFDFDRGHPLVVMVAGVNGAGKTTSIGKLAKWFAAQGKSVLLAAGDTFRAAAIEQLQVWGDRNNVPVIAQAAGADPAAVTFDALQSAKARGTDVLVADTAGRLHTQSNLMEELKKVRRVMTRLDPTAPHEVLLVLDAGQGQNALAQAQQFQQAVGVTGLVMTKLDGTAKGGIVLAIADTLKLPIRYIGIGETAADFDVFDAGGFVDAVLAPSRDGGAAQ